jgi:hypothetical protein
LDYPIGRLNKRKRGDPAYSFQVMPSSLTTIECQYIRKPARIVIGGTYGSGGFIPDPNAVGNVNPEWNDLDMKYLIGKTVIALGLPLDDQAVQQYGLIIDKQGV